MNDTELIGMIAALHIVALAAGALLVLALARPDDERSSGPEDEGARGGDGPPRPTPPPIGPPLLDADQARVRLRQRDRLTDRQPSRRRHRPMRRRPARVREQKPRD